ncbi:MAG: hypothetical protein WC889_02715 [Myxococcota bacterium]|jgi:hypothetical protein
MADFPEPQPMETAPKDGTMILIWSDSYEQWQSGMWAWAWGLPDGLGFEDRTLDTTEGYWVEKPYVSYDAQRWPYRPIHEATLWMPLPPHPQPKDTRDG